MQSVLRSLRVLEAVASHDPLRVGELAPMLGLSKSTTQRSLRTLEEAGWIVAVEGDVTRWRLAPHAVSILGRSRSGFDLREAALPVMRSLRDETGETVHLSVGTGIHQTVIVERAESRHELRTAVPIGTTFRDLEAASGIALLAAAADAYVDEALDWARVQGVGAEVSEATWQQVRRAREVGYAATVSPGGQTIGIAAVVGQEQAAIALVVPLFRFSQNDEAALGADVVRAARRVGSTVGRQSGSEHS